MFSPYRASSFLCAYALAADIEGVDSDLDLDAMKGTDSENEAPREKRKYTRRARVSDFPERAHRARNDDVDDGAPRRRGRPPLSRSGESSSSSSSSSSASYSMR